MARRQKNAMATEGEGKAREEDPCVDCEDFLGSSKLQGLQCSNFVKLEHSDDGIPTVSAARSRLRGMTKMSSAEEAMTDVEQSNRRRQGSRAKGKLESIPEDAGMGMRSLEQELLSSRPILKEEKEEQEKCTREEKQEQGKLIRKRMTAKEEDQDKYVVQEEEQQQRKSEEEQQQKQRKTATCRRAPAKKAGFHCSPTIPPSIKASILSPIQESQWLDSVSSENLDPLRSDTPLVTLEENMFQKRTNCSPAITGKLGPLTAKTNSTQIPVKTVLKKDQAPSVRSSTRMKKDINISSSLENDSNEKRFLLTSEVASRAAAKRNTSAEKLPSGTAKRVKKDPASMKEEISAPDTATNPSGTKRGTRYQLSKSLEVLNIQGAAAAQNQVDVKSTAATEHKETSSAEKLECLTQNKGRKPVSNKRTLSRTAQKTKILKVAEESTYWSTVSLTGSPEPMEVVNAEGAATLKNQVSVNSISALEPEEWSITNADSEFDNITQKKGKRNASKKRPFSKTAQEIKNLKTAEESTCLDSLPLAAGGGSEEPRSKSSEVFYVQWAAIGQNQVNVKSIAAMEYEDKRTGDDITNNLECMTQNKRRKAVTKQRAPSGAKKNKALKMADCLDTFPLAAGEGNEQENSTSLGVSFVKGALIVQNQVKAKSMADMESEEIRGSGHKIDADKKLDVKIQNRGRNTVTKKRALSGTAQKTKKLKIAEESTCSDTLPLAASPKPSEVITVTAQNQVNVKAISATKPEEWNADDITNAYSKVEDILQNKGKEYVKKKRAMSFDALPVGFGLGISGWLPSPLSSQYMPEGVVDHLEVGKLVMGLQAQEMDPILNLYMSETLSEEAKKKQCLQEAAEKMGGDESLLGQGDVNSLPAHHSTSSTTESERQSGKATASATEGCAAEQDTVKPIVLAGEHQQGKAKVKRQAGKITKASKALAPPLATTHTNSIIMLDEEGLESTTRLDHNDEPELEVRRSSRRRAAISCREKSTRNRKP